MAELLLWSSVLAYGEATAAFGIASRHPARAGRFGTWGIRLGWLAQTGLLAVQVVRADGFPWSTWAGSLNLFVWLVVTGYLIWGCRPRYRLLGLGVAPLAFALLVVAWLAGGTGGDAESSYSTLFLVLHVGFVLAAFAGFTLAAARAGLYLWQERRLQSRSPSVLRIPVPSLATLDRLEGRTIVVALPALTLGIVAGFLRVRSTGAGFDPLMVVTVVTWLVYGAFIVLRYGAGWRGRRAAYLALAGFALVLAVRLGLPVTHFS